MVTEHYPSKCTFCDSPMTFTVKNGKKVVDKPCSCRRSESYFSESAKKERAEAEKAEAKRVSRK